MGLQAVFDSFVKYFGVNRNSSYEMDERWEELLNELRDEVEDNGFDLEENEELYISLLAHVVKDNEEGLEMLAEEEAAQRARTGEDSPLDKSASVNIKTIRPSSD